MSDELDPTMASMRDDIAAYAGPIIGHQQASLGAARFALFMQGHANLQAMSLFLVMGVMTVPQTGYSDEALAALRNDARDVRDAADEWARQCEELADHWQAQRREAER